jgi:hypothetical protein
MSLAVLLNTRELHISFATMRLKEQYPTWRHNSYFQTIKENGEHFARTNGNCVPITKNQILSNV